MNPWVRPTAPLVIAHRGHSAGAPEQTMAAFRAAIDLGAHMIECDIHRTRDHHLVMLHDDTVDRTTSGSGRVRDIDLATLRGLDAGAWFGPEFAGERVPSLDEVFELGAAAGVRLCLEVKSDDARQGTELAVEVAAAIADRGRLDVDVLASFDHPALCAAVAARPGLALAPDRVPERGPMAPEALVAQARAIGAAIIQHHHADLDAATVAACHQAGVAVWAWPTNTPDDIDRALRSGVDGLMGDDVAAIRDALR
jgi:glycerophosphoryl diester phosphodiesterase